MPPAKQADGQVRTRARHAQPTVLDAEADTAQMQTRIKKEIALANIPYSIGELYRRGITPGTFWIIGYPGETPASMRETLRMAAEVKYLFPSAGSEVYPFRPIPGTEDFKAAIELGYVPPKDFHDWGKCFEYKYSAHNTPLPEAVRETWRLYNNTSAIYDRKIHEGPAWMRRLLAEIAGWRLKKHRCGFPLEQKLFDVYVRATGQTDPGAKDYVPAVDA